MHFDERALLEEQVHRSLYASKGPRRGAALLDGPLWWLGPIAILAGVGVLLIAIPWPRPSAAPHTPAETIEPDRRGRDAIAWSSASFSRN